jgi:AraC-like DNA-binding protein
MGHSYQQYLPTARTQRFVDAFWISEPTETRMGRVLPDGCSDIILYTSAVERRISFVGPMTMAERIEVQAGTRYVGIRFKPGTVIKHNPGLPFALRDKTVPVPATYTNVLSTLQSRHHSNLNLLDDLEHWVMSLTREGDLIRDPEVDCLLEAVQDNPIAKLESLYETLNVSPRTIERRFLKMVGLTPKFFARVQRHQRAVRELSTTDDAFSMAALAHHLHYADQAHFIRDFASLAGITPGEYQTEQRN